MDKGLIKLGLVRPGTTRRLPYYHVLIDNHKIGSIGGLLDPRYIIKNKSRFWHQKSFELTPGKHTICIVTTLLRSSSEIIDFDLPPNGCIEFECGDTFWRWGQSNSRNYNFFLGAALFLCLFYFGVIVALGHFIPHVISYYLGIIFLPLIFGLIVVGQIRYVINSRTPGFSCFIEKTS